MSTIASLIVEEVAGEWNLDGLRQAAQAFGIELETNIPDEPACLIALENRPGACCVYEYRSGEAFSLVVGNEARGIRRATLKRASAIVEIPVVSRNVNCLNVAAAAAVALHYLSLSKSFPFPTRTAESVRKNRPTILISGVKDHMELGSAIRSACAFGWGRVYLDDRFDAWYRCDRIIKSEGRGAARRGRNPIRVIPCSSAVEAGFDRVIVPADRATLHDQRLTGSRTLLRLQGDSSVDGLCFRLWATIVMAEAARQLGRANSPGIYLRGHKDRYRKALDGEEEVIYCLADFGCFDNLARLSDMRATRAR